MATFFFFNDTATTEIYTLSLHDALPIYGAWSASTAVRGGTRRAGSRPAVPPSLAEFPCLPGRVQRPSPGLLRPVLLGHDHERQTLSLPYRIAVTVLPAAPG